MLKLLGGWTLHCHSVMMETLWKPLKTMLWLLLCEKVAIRSLVPGEVAVMDTFFSILSPGCRTAILGEREEKRNVKMHCLARLKVAISNGHHFSVCLWVMGVKYHQLFNKWQVQRFFLAPRPHVLPFLQPNKANAKAVSLFQD